MISRHYFKLYDDVYIEGRWYPYDLVNPQGEEIDLWQFTTGKPLDIREELRCRISHPGHPLDFSEAVHMVPVVSARAREHFERLGGEDLQFFPVQVEAQAEPYFIMNVTRLVDCIDEARCHRVVKWQPEDGRPERLGDYRVVEDLHIDPARVGDERFFRLKGWTDLVVPAEIKQALEQAGLTGMRFWAV